MPDTDVSCTLCGLPVARGGVDGEAGPFCCPGCRDIHEVLGEEELPAQSGVDSLDVEETAAIEEVGDIIDKPDRSTATAFFRVEGMHCSTCETYLERVGHAEPGIDEVEASYVTETVRVRYDPDRTDDERISDRLSGLGYQAYPRDDDIARRSAENQQFGRLAAGVLFGMMVMLQYIVIIYPTYFGGLFYDDRTTAFLSTALATGSGRYFFVVIWILTSIVLVFTGGPILRGALVSLRARAPNMDLLIALAATSAYLYSALAVLTGRTDIYFDVTVAIIVVVTVGGYYERSMKREATETLADLTRARVEEARRLAPDGRTETVSPTDLMPGDRVLVNPGERVPVDGTLEGEPVAVDESIITGESLPRRRRPGETVIGGSVVVDGAAIVAVGEEVESSVDRIAGVVWTLQSENRGIQKLADKLATIFVPVVAILAAVVFVGYLLAGASVTTAMLVGLTMLIVSCPCALGLATPLAVASSIREALERGIVVFDDTVFERIRDVDVIVFDKTGTLTTGEMTVRGHTGSAELLRQAALLEQRSAHPIGRAIVERFGPESTPNRQRADGGTIADPENERVESAVTEFTGHRRGVSGTVDGDAVMVGHPDLFTEHGWAMAPSIERTVEAIREAGNAPVVVGRNGRTGGVIGIGDEPRPYWEATVRGLQDHGTAIYVLTGDDERAAAEFASHPAVERVFAGVPPEAKAETIRRLGTTGRTVMVGEGTNDAPALAAADLGIAMGGGTAMAADAADVAILEDDLRAIDEVFDIAEAAGRRVKQNIGWAFLYNAIAIPVAIAGLLNPLFAAVAMGLSSAIVVTNSSRALIVRDDDADEA